MNQAYTILPSYILAHAISKNDVRYQYSKKLDDDRTMKYYIYIGNYQVLISIDDKVFGFRTIEEGHAFYQRTTSTLVIRHEYQINHDNLNEPVDLNYRLMTYEFFKSCRLATHRGALVVSENILNDGRVSVIYSKLSYREGEIDGHFLVIGRLVFTHYRVEELKKFEDAISDGSATYWRPELSGTMDYIPSYSISVFSEGRHRKFASIDLLLNEYSMPGNTSAWVYKGQNRTTRYYMRWRDRFYSFATLQDCELIIFQLQAKSTLERPPVMKPEYDCIAPSIKVIAARLSRYMTADISRSPSDVLKVSQTGSLTGLSAII